MYLQRTFFPEMYKEDYYPHLKSIAGCPDASGCRGSPFVLLVRRRGPLLITLSILGRLVRFAGRRGRARYTLTEQHRVSIGRRRRSRIGVCKSGVTDRLA